MFRRQVCRLVLGHAFDEAPYPRGGLPEPFYFRCRRCRHEKPAPPVIRQ